MQHFITELPAATSSFPLNLMISILALLFAIMNIAVIYIGALTYFYPMVFVSYLITNLSVLNLHYYPPASSLNALIATVNEFETAALLICALQCVAIFRAFCLMTRRWKTAYHIGFWAQVVLCMGVRALVVFCEPRFFKSSLVAWVTMLECLVCSLIVMWQETESVSDKTYIVVDCIELKDHTR